MKRRLRWRDGTGGHIGEARTGLAWPAEAMPAAGVVQGGDNVYVPRKKRGRPGALRKQHTAWRRRCATEAYALRAAGPETSRRNVVSRTLMRHRLLQQCLAGQASRAGDFAALAAAACEGRARSFCAAVVLLGGADPRKQGGQ